MKRRMMVATAVAAAVVGLVAPVRASAEVADGWDHRPLAVGGPYQAVVGQFGGDEATDILFYGTGSVADSLWIGHQGQRGSAAFSKVNLAIGGAYTPIVGDFGGDDYDDILFYGPGSAVDSLWISTDSSAYFDKTRKVSVGGAYQPKVLHDYRDLGAKDDILFLGPGAAKDYYWHFTDKLSDTYFGPATYKSRELKVNGAYQLVIGDYSGDAIEDVVLYQPGTAKDYKWVSDVAGAFKQTNLTVTGNFNPRVVYQADYDGIFWNGHGAQAESYWTSNGTSFTSRTVDDVGSAAGPGTDLIGWSLGLGAVAVVDPADTDGAFVGDQTGGGYVSLASAAYDQGTAQALVGDFDADGFVDVAWYGPGSQPDQLWYTDAAGKAARTAPSGTGVKATPVAIR